MSKTVDTIYELIEKDYSKKTLDNNIDLFLDFYRHDMMAWYNGYKVIEIYKYLLSLNLEDDNEIFPYINSRIMQDFNDYEIGVTQSVYMGDFQASQDYVELIYKLIDAYEVIKQYSDKTSLTKITPDISFIRDYTACMMVILNKSFFQLDKDTIFKMIRSIRNNAYLKHICDNGMGKQLLDRDYIFQYCSRYLCTDEFVNYDNFGDDYLLTSLKEGKIKDQGLVKKIIQKTDIYYLLIIFDYKVSNYLDMLERISNDKLFHLIHFNLFFNQLLDYDLIIFALNFIMEDERSNNYLNDEQKDKIIDKVVDYYPPYLNDKQILFLLEKSNNTLLKINIRENLKNNHWSDDTKKKVKEIIDYKPGIKLSSPIELSEEEKKLANINMELLLLNEERRHNAIDNGTTNDISVEDAINTLDNIFKDKEKDVSTCFAALKALIRKFLGDDNVNVYLGKYKDCNGLADYPNYAININLIAIQRLLNCQDYEKNPEALHILDTIFHEARHLKQFKEMESAGIDSEAYKQYKEDLLCKLLNHYYSNNYYGINLEKDARVVGAQSLGNLLSSCFPYLPNCIKYYYNLAIQEQNKDYGDKKIFELSAEVNVDEVLEKMISICPSIVKDHPLLLLEYDLEGHKKNGESLNNKVAS
ncbi:MAG: hypothetical protein IJR82_00630 [Bacilli bacterium]|nr:hypothetical protein [Bacilli bacterium]